MNGTAINSLKVALHHAEPKNQRKDLVKETSAIVVDLIKKISNPNRSEVIEALRGVGFSELEASQALRHLEDNGEIFIVEDSSFLKVIAHRDTSPYEREQSKLQQAWIRAREQGVFS